MHVCSVLTFTKKTAASDLWITYDDTLGWNMVPYTDAGSWRLTLDGVARLENRFHSQQVAYYWYIMPFSLHWYMQNVAAGSHTIKIQAVRFGGSSEVLHGWPDQGTFVRG